ncbi:MAG: hypothetical protein ACK5O8_14335 [Pirellula sp.]
MKKFIQETIRCWREQVTHSEQSRIGGMAPRSEPPISMGNARTAQRGGSSLGASQQVEVFRTHTVRSLGCYEKPTSDGKSTFGNTVRPSARGTEPAPEVYLQAGRFGNEFQGETMDRAVPERRVIR